MLALALPVCIIAILMSHVAADEGNTAVDKKSTYDFEGNFGSFTRIWVPQKGCSLLMQGPLGSQKWSDKAWDSVMKCDQVKVFPYCVSDQASNGKGKDLKDVANIIHATQENGLNRAWGEDYVYLVPLPEATEENRDLDRISGATAPNAAIKLIYRYGYIAGGSYYDDKWLANKVSCSSPYKWTMEQKFLY